MMLGTIKTIKSFSHSFFIKKAIKNLYKISVFNLFKKKLELLTGYILLRIYLRI